MEIQLTEPVPKVKGTASTFKAADFIPAYTEAVEKFLRDNASLGENWQRDVAKKLYNFQGKNKEGDVLGSSPYMGVAIATFLSEISLIGGKQLLELYEQAGKKNPFGSVYIDFGVNLNGGTEINKNQAEALLDSFIKYGINMNEGRVPDFAQLRLVADQKSGLVFKLAEGVQDKDVANVSDYPFGSYVGKHGLFSACLDRSGRWYAYGDVLVGSDGDGRVVRYDAEGVAPKKIKETDLVSNLKQDFVRKF